MANTPQPKLNFNPGCPDCGYRDIELPEPLPDLGDDFDWLVRDYDGFRLFMMEELLARFPERTRWTPADMEVVIVETLAVVLDQLSDMLDRVHTEAFLETARQPESVLRLLKMIGYDAVLQSGSPDTLGLLKQWKQEPRLMELARQAGPKQIHTQKRMVTEADYAERLDDHPLVLRAQAWSRWSGTWITIQVAIIGIGNRLLDDALTPGPLETPEDIQAIQEQVNQFHHTHGLAHGPDDNIVWNSKPTIRTLLRKYIDNYRMVGQEVWLQDAKPVGIHITLSVRVQENYFQSEIRRRVMQAMSTDIGGFFEPGHLTFGEDLHASDILETVMALEGVEVACLNRFKRVGKRYSDQSDTGTIVLNELEIAVCDNNPQAPARGYLKIILYQE